MTKEALIKNIENWMTCTGVNPEVDREHWKNKVLKDCTGRTSCEGCEYQHANEGKILTEVLKILRKE